MKVSLYVFYAPTSQLIEMDFFNDTNTVNDEIISIPTTSTIQWKFFNDAM